MNARAAQLRKTWQHFGVPSRKAWGNVLLAPVLLGVWKDETTGMPQHPFNEFDTGGDSESLPSPNLKAPASAGAFLILGT